MQLGVLNQIMRSAQLNTLLITFGLDVVFTYLALLVFTADFRTINPSYAGANVTIARHHRSACAPGGFRASPGCSPERCGSC